MDLIDNSFRHGKRSPTTAVDSSASAKADEVICARIIAGPGSNGTKGAFFHIIAVFFMCLCVLTKLNSTM